MTSAERPTARAHREIAAVLKSGDLAIDATAGNGHDTVFLAGLVGEQGRVIAFDVQEAAISATRARLEAAELAGRVELFQESHGHLLNRAGRGMVTAIMFNLGYFPGGDHALITRTDETLVALDQARAALKAGGVLTIVCYPGHPGGDEESEAVLAWLGTLAAPDFSSEVVRRTETLRPSPFLVVVTRG